MGLYRRSHRVTLSYISAVTVNKASVAVSRGSFGIRRLAERRRYSSGVQSTFCARPGCTGRADAWLAYDYAAQRIWLDDRPEPTSGDQWGLCEYHAGRLRAPKGWSEVDRRVGRRWEPPASLVS